MKRYQQGIGLIEVLVALMLLAIAVLGFTAMQMTAVKATDESLMRTRALTVMRGAAEMMRANPTGICAFKLALNNTSLKFVDNSDNPQTMNVLNSGCSEYVAPESPPKDYVVPANRTVSVKKIDCTTGDSTVGCSIEQLAMHDALNLKKYATDNELSMGMATCPNTRNTVTNADNTTTTTISDGQDRQCLIASWGDTDPIFLDTAVATDTTKDKPCADEDGVYQMGVQCFIMEAY